MNVLVVAAHPDDEALGCGGTIARLAEDGHLVTIAILSRGIEARGPDHEAVTALGQHSLEAALLLGARHHHIYSFPDQQFDTMPFLKIVQAVEVLIESFRPQVIYTHCGSDLNTDHVLCHRAILTATRPTGGHLVERIYGFEVLSSTEWGFGQVVPHFQPNVFVEITDTLEVKIQAMLLYKTEIRTFPHPRSPEAVRALARLRGSTVGVHAAEAFQLIREVR